MLILLRLRTFVDLFNEEENKLELQITYTITLRRRSHIQDTGAENLRLSTFSQTSIISRSKTRQFFSRSKLSSSTFASFNRRRSTLSTRNFFSSRDPSECSINHRFRFPLRARLTRAQALKLLRAVQIYDEREYISMKRGRGSLKPMYALYTASDRSNFSIFFIATERNDRLNDQFIRRAHVMTFGGLIEGMDRG